MFDVLSKPNVGELKKMKLFSDVADETIEGIVESFVIRRLKKHEVLLAPEQPNHYLYLVLSGRLCVYLEPSLLEAVSCFGPGEPVGELSIIDNSSTSAYVVADEDCRVLVLEETQVWSLLRESHAFTRNLLQNLSGRLRQANRVITDKNKLEDSFIHYGMLDVLTGMHSRKWFDQMIDRALKRCTLQGKPFSVLLADVDDFSSFNERHGRICGDLALNTIAHTIQEHMRATELAVRYDGDRLLIILPETDLQQTRKVAERLRMKVMYTTIPAPGGRAFNSLTVSVGIAQATEDQTVEEFMTTVMIALKRAKDMGKNYVSD
jgi:diguanylate cyclase (GGDEF)-like protein